MTNQLSGQSRPTVKRMSDTRLSACADATKALVEGYDEINTALEEIADDVEEKPEIKEEARGMASYMNQLETGILAALWHDILHRFHGNSQVLQSADQDLNSAVAIYESLIEFIGKLRERFAKNFVPKGRSSVNVTISWMKLDASVNEIAVTTSQDQCLKCNRLQPTSFVRVVSW